MQKSIWVAVACLLTPLALGQRTVTNPKAFLGHDVGEDYWLANYKQLSDYWRKVDTDSNRVQVVSIGKTEEGRDQLMAIISDPPNMRQLARYRAMARRLALGDATAPEALRFSEEGKAIIWIDGGLHASEVLGAQQLIETVYRLASREDEETKRILRDCIVLVVHANPDGMDLVSDWYMRKPNPRERSTSGVPRLYQKYIGHDNNRDFYANTQSETINMNRILYREWFPQIMYNHHQTAPSGTIIFAPPFRGPFNYHVDPLVEVTTGMVGMAMHTRFVSEGKPGAVMRNAASYQTWWNGGLRTTAYFHNMVGILTEAFGSPNPSRINFSAQRLVPTTDIPFPIEPQEWRFAQSIEYELTANYAIMDYASRYKSQLLRNTYTMARNAIEKGRKDTWTLYPKRVGSARNMAAIQTPENRDAKAYVVSADQVDFPTATKFINSLMHAGVVVHRASAPLSIAGKTYPVGSFVVRSDQAFRAHVLDMFEPQDYPNDFQYLGAHRSRPTTTRVTLSLIRWACSSIEFWNPSAAQGLKC
ncbi:MAG: M14 family metallopeptidase [Armatimonadota bacterium]|nr:M14 family metallopeptidase [Armatimonadota bacterium]